MLENSYYDAALYNLCEELEQSNNILPNQIGHGLKRKSTTVDSNVKSKLMCSQEPSTSKDIDTTECTICNISIKSRYFTNHLKSNRHKNNVIWKQHNLLNVKIIESAFGHRIVTYRIYPSNIASNIEIETFYSTEHFYENIKESLEILITNCLREFKCIKVNFIFKANFVQPTKDIENEFDFPTTNYIINEGTDLESILKSLFDILNTKIVEFERKDSGWSLKSMTHIDMNVNKFNPLRGSSYIDLPSDIKAKKAIVNVKNNDCYCFKWALLSALHPVSKNSDRVSSYKKYENSLNFGGIAFPIKIKDIAKIETLNNISINVFTLEYDKIKNKNSIVGPIYFTKCRKESHINLLYFTNNSISHYCFIKNMSRLVSSQLSADREIYICDGCLLHFRTKDKLDTHQRNDCIHVRVDLPRNDILKENWFGDKIPETILKFNNYDKKNKIPFVIYADFEAFIKPIASCCNDPSKSGTMNIAEHEVYSFGYYLKCSYDDQLSKYVTYTGPNCADEFLKCVHSDMYKIFTIYTKKTRPRSLTSEEKNKIEHSEICYICDNKLNGKKYIDYCWYTGIYNGVAHEHCSQKFNTPSFLPVFLHNLSNYDAHFIIKALNFVDGNIELLPQNKEKYISFSKCFKINNRYVKIRFLDSFKFMSSSLSSLANNLKDEQFIELKKCFKYTEDFNLLKRKGIYPYEYMKSFDSLSLKSLPKRENFYSSLFDSNITNKEYSHALKVWSHFKCKSMSDYSDLYLKTDVLLLTDVFENFREICLKTYGLDPAHYYTAPGLSWDAMLKHTNISLELLTDFDKISFVKTGIRGGISQCSNRHAKANNKYMSDYDHTKASSYLTYLDANNLYGWAMSQYLPINGFEWVNVDVDFNIPSTSNVGYILEVDLEYPKNLHDLHSDLPLCPQNISIGDTNEIKLVLNLYNKNKYVIHYRNLQQCLELGMKLVKIHRVLKFNQSPWLEKYIKLNTDLRTIATSKFEKDFYKLMNNSIFGKTMENIEKRVDVKLLTRWYNQGVSRGAQEYISKPQFHSLSIFSENLVAIQLKRVKLFYNKPIYLGFCILDLSKTLMYDFHYKYMLNKFSNNIKLMYTDTDSFIYHIFSPDFYSDIKNDIDKYFDTSDYEIKNKFGFRQVNKKKIGYFKDENNGQIFKEFVGLRAKMYAMDVENSFTAKAKGVNKCVTQKLTIQNYKECLFEKNIQMAEMHRFKSIKHMIYTQKLNKKSLSHDDTKRFILPDLVSTLAWGHYKLDKTKKNDM